MGSRRPRVSFCWMNVTFRVLFTSLPESFGGLRRNRNSGARFREYPKASPARHIATKRMRGDPWRGPVLRFEGRAGSDSSGTHGSRHAPFLEYGGHSATAVCRHIRSICSPSC